MDWSRRLPQCGLMRQRRASNGLSRGWGVVVAGTAATFFWGWTMGSAPRYSFGADQDTGNFGLLLLGLAVVAAIAGALTPRHTVIVGATTVVVPILLAPGTAPRGDGDGLWGLVFFALAWWLPVAIGLACVGGLTRDRVPGRRRR